MDKRDMPFNAALRKQFREDPIPTHKKAGQGKFNVEEPDLEARLRAHEGVHIWTSQRDRGVFKRTGAQSRHHAGLQ